MGLDSNNDDGVKPFISYVAMYSFSVCVTAGDGDSN